jgi:hypothetical protein
MGTPSFQIRPGNPDFLDLAWDRPVNEWDGGRLCTMPTGIHRHPVVFVAYDEGIYAIKEMSRRLAANEYRVLRALQEETHRVAQPAGLVGRDWLDPHEEGAGAVITRYVDHTFPYRRLVSGSGFGARRSQMLDALASLLVELHLAGCYWGDCSLSNVLYRFDAGSIEAIMIDAETSAVHDELSDGQRHQDVEIMKENLAGEMADIAAEMGGGLAEADMELGLDVAARYDALWDELTQDLVIKRDENYQIRERIARINDLGFAVDDIEIAPVPGGDRVRMSVRVGGRTYNSDVLQRRTGVVASENQARTILGDLEYFYAVNGYTSPTERNVGTYRWLNDWFEPLTARIADIWHGEDPVQGYCDYLNHRMTMAQKLHADVDPMKAFEDWVANGFPGFDMSHI